MTSSLELNPEIFRAYDIRGIVGKDIDESIATTMGKAIGTYLLKNFEGNNVVVGMDNRLHSEGLKKALVEGLLSVGCNVTDIGMSTSPMMYWAVYNGDYCGGIEVSASHNPKEYNGFKIVGTKAYPVAGAEIDKIKEIAFSKSFESGSGVFVAEDIEERYLKDIAGKIHLEKKLKVVVDTGNGVAGKFAPKLYRMLGCEVEEVFCNLDGTFPNHVPNPEHEANLLDAEKAVVRTMADIGIGIDGDGDRVGLIDNEGKFLSSDYTIIFLARDYLPRHPGDQVLVDVKSSQNVLDEIKRLGGKPLLYKTGHSLIKLKMRADNLILGGEFSGHLYVFENYYPFDDSMYSSSKIIEILSKSSEPMSEQFKSLRTLYATDLLELGCPDAIKFEVMDKVVKTFEKTHEVNAIDGARVAFPDGWAIVRASNTSPTLTFRAEGNSKANLKIVLNEMLNVLNGFEGINTTPISKVIDTL